MSHGNVEPYLLQDDGSMPNNPTLPLLVYSGVLQLKEDPTSDCRALFKRNHWGKSWISGVYSYHHYHSTAHEVLGVTRGTAVIQFGGEHGPMMRLKAGDVVVIPAGVGHCNRGASDDFRVVGAYPEGQDWDLRTGQPDERPQVIWNIENVPLPGYDPVYGSLGPLMQFWEESVRSKR